jgi:signal transduction histidine kinase
MPNRESSQPGMGDWAEAAHELRRPLGVAQGYLTMLLEGHLGSLADAQRRALLRIQSKLAETQNQLEQQVLQGRLDADAVAPALRRLDLVEVAESAIERAQPRIELAGGSLRFEPPQFGVPAIADSALLARILDNLLDNAITYADGTPQVSVRVGLADGPFLRICDGGAGMDPALRERIFARGFRADPGGGRPGSGLGLYLSRRAAQLMGASLWVEWTQPGEGSCFRLDLKGPQDDLPGQMALG